MTHGEWFSSVVSFIAFVSSFSMLLERLDLEC